MVPAPMPTLTKDKCHKNKEPAPVVIGIQSPLQEALHNGSLKGSTRLTKLVLAPFTARAPVPAGRLTCSTLIGVPHNGTGLTELAPVLFTVLAPAPTGVKQ